AVDAYHHGNWERPTAAVRANFRIMRLDQCFQLRPRHHRRHLGQKHVALRALLLPCKVQRRKAQLRIHPVPSESRAQCAMLHAVVQKFLKNFRGTPKHPTILIVDNDSGPEDLFKQLSSLLKKKVDGGDKYYFVYANLYVVPVPKVGADFTSMEQLFEAKKLATKLG